MRQARLTVAAALRAVLLPGLLPVLLPGVTACGTPEVTRIVDGQWQRGPFIHEGAYAFYARGAFAEATGDVEGALQAYRWAASQDPASPDAWVRIGALECAHGRSGASGASDASDASDASGAFGRAESVRADFAPLYRERARCWLGRGAGARALSDAERALALDPDDLDTALVYADAVRATGGAEAAVRVLRGLAIRYPRSTAPWRALADIARATANAGLAREAAEALAAASADQGSTAPPGPATVATVDAALRRGDLREAQRRALGSRIGDADLAVRAAALGIAGLALEQAELVIAADPADTSARIALAAAADLRGDVEALTAAMRAIPRVATPPSPLARWLFADVLRRRVGADAAVAWLGGPASGPAPSDALTRATELRVRKALGTLQ